jgi:hypothetical protein
MSFEASGMRTDPLWMALMNKHLPALLASGSRKSQDGWQQTAAILAQEADHRTCRVPEMA